MDLSKLRGGQLIAALGGIVLLVALLFLNWYGGETKVSIGFIEGEFGAEFGAWDHQGFLGTLANLVILAAGIVAVGLAVLTATSRTVALPIAASALTAAGGISAVIMVLLRMLFQPGDGEFINLEFGIYMALVGAVAIAYGGWESMREEGTTFDEARAELQERLGDRGSRGPRTPSASTPPRTEPPASEPSSGTPRPGGEPAPPERPPPMSPGP